MEPCKHEELLSFVNIERKVDEKENTVARVIHLAVKCSTCEQRFVFATNGKNEEHISIFAEEL